MNYDQLANQQVIDKTITSLAERNIEAMVVGNKIEAMEKIKSLIPSGASVMNGSSRTLEEIGYVDYLKAGQHSWNNLHEAVLAEQDKVKQAILRKQSVISDYYLGSVHALAETGEIVIASNTGSQLPHVVYTSPNIIFVVGTQKIVPTLSDALKRLEEHVVPLEDERMMQAYNMHTNQSKVLILRYEAPFNGRKIKLLLVKEKLGF